MRRRRLALAAFGLVWIVIARVALALPRGSLPAWLRRLTWVAARLPAPPACATGEAAWAITAAARRVPGTRCLAWALALRGLLEQAGVASELRIGVASGGSGAITAHAWIEHAGRTW